MRQIDSDVSDLIEEHEEKLGWRRFLTKIDSWDEQIQSHLCSLSFCVDSSRSSKETLRAKHLLHSVVAAVVCIARSKPTRVFFFIIFSLLLCPAALVLLSRSLCWWLVDCYFSKERKEEEEDRIHGENMLVRSRKMMKKSETAECTFMCVWACVCVCVSLVVANIRHRIVVPKRFALFPLLAEPKPNGTWQGKEQSVSIESTNVHHPSDENTSTEERLLLLSSCFSMGNDIR